MISAIYSMKESVSRQQLPVYAYPVAAGFPSPAEDYIEAKLDLNELLIKDAPATFMVRVRGDSMVNAGIGSGDILVIDRGIEPLHGHIVLAVLDGEFTVKRLYKRDGDIKLLPENPHYAAIELESGQELVIWGVVTSAIKQFL